MGVPWCFEFICYNEKLPQVIIDGWYVNLLENLNFIPWDCIFGGSYLEEADYISELEIKNKNGKIEVNMPTIPKCGIGHYSRWSNNGCKYHTN